MKNFNKIILLLVLMFGLVACKNNQTSEETTTTESSQINVVSREEGSGTRGAFTELTKVSDGKVDNTYEKAIIQSSTDGVITTVSTDKNAIGYISLGSLNNEVKALNLDGVEPTVENIKAGTYKLSRPFLLTYKEAELDDVAKDFLAFVTSSDAASIIEGKHYILANDHSNAYTKPENLEGKIIIVGSTSVTPLMETIVDAYNKLNPNVEINIESPGSSAGIQASIDGIANIGMSSRELKDEEKSAVNSLTLALDGIAVIVANDNPTSDISSDSLKAVFTGEIQKWEEVK